MQKRRKAVKWFHPKTHTGWRQVQTPTTRRRKLLASTSKRLSLRERYLQAGRRIHALANVNIKRNKKTSKIAKSDANYFFSKIKKLRSKKK